MFLVGGIIIGMVIMVAIFDRYDRRTLARHMKQVDALLGRINELSRQNRSSAPSSERPSA
jgi:hypothetical protein